MEVLTSVIAFVVVASVLIAVSYWYAYVLEPRKRTPQIIEALEQNERIGLSDIDVDIKRTAARWGLLNMGHKESKRFKVEAYLDRIDAQIRVLEPKKQDLRRARVKLNAVDQFLSTPS